MLEDGKVREEVLGNKEGCWRIGRGGEWQGVGKVAGRVGDGKLIWRNRGCFLEGERKRDKE